MSDKSANRQRPRILRAAVIGLISLALVAAGSLVVSHLVKFDTQRSIHIAVPPERVWAELVALDKYPEWSPGLQPVGSASITSEGQQLHITTGNLEFTPTVTEFDSGRRLAWLGRLYAPQLADGNHYFTLEAQPDGTTVLTQGERFTGVLAPLTPLLLDQGSDFDKFNAALKNRVEGRQP